VEQRTLSEPARVRAHDVDLPGRGSTVVWEVPGPPGGPVLLLLHGVTLTALLNWRGIAGRLGQRYRVLMLDQRGHGAGLPARPFRLEDCADDVAAVAAHFGVGRIVVVGYSMGGLVAQLVWRRHPSLVSGLVLCSTTRNASGAPWERSAALAMPGLVAAASWLFPAQALRADVVGSALLDHATDPRDRRFALAEMRRTSLVDALAAIQAVCAFSSHTWIGSVDVPTAVLVTKHDRVVPARRQWKLARAVPHSTVIELDGGHDVFLTSPGRLAAAVETACAVVSSTTSVPTAPECDALGA
jgi:3-oxoadipate enol-lactonase